MHYQTNTSILALLCLTRRSITGSTVDNQSGTKLEFKPFNILALDGGGVWSLIQVRALKAIFGEDAKGHDVLSHFQLVAGNSSGALILGALIEDLALLEIEQLFLDPAQRRKIFAPLNALHVEDEALVGPLGLGPKYSAAHKLVGIQTLLPNFGSARLDTLSGAGVNKNGWPKFLICAFDYDLRRETFFRSDAESLANDSLNRHSPTLVEAIHASTNTPIDYFDLPARFPANPDFMGRRYWDGAVAGSNNPVLAAVTEAIANRARYACPTSSIHVLSIGTGNNRLPLDDPDSPLPADADLAVHRTFPNLKKDVAELIKSIFSDPPDAATYITHVALDGEVTNVAGHPVSGRVIRMNPLVSPLLKGTQTWGLPAGLTYDEFSTLAALDIDATSSAEIALVGKFCDLWLRDSVPNQPIRANEHFETLIGHGVFSRALAAFRSFP
ncbi:patatin-like phospholipase family protein [Paraburkholderia aspalathi]|uniref:patatin-like phospholipase family protein n=1 Tax=Paraburkholderia aspalathi TaxID=1324617 RepID=UPI003CA8D994